MTCTHSSRSWFKKRKLDSILINFCTLAQNKRKEKGRYFKSGSIWGLQMTKAIGHIPILLITKNPAKKGLGDRFPPSPHSAEIRGGWTISLDSLEVGIFNDDKLWSPAPRQLLSTWITTCCPGAVTLTCPLSLQPPGTPDLGLHCWLLLSLQSDPKTC